MAGSVSTSDRTSARDRHPDGLRSGVERQRGLDPGDEDFGKDGLDGEVHDGTGGINPHGRDTDDDGVIDADDHYSTELDQGDEGASECDAGR